MIGKTFLKVALCIPLSGNIISRLKVKNNTLTSVAGEPPWQPGGGCGGDGGGGSRL